MFPELDRGTRIGKYEILTRLSVGGMAEIFLAAATGPGGFRKFVTLKRILPDLREDEQFVQMFLQEARISAALSHSNIAQVFELGEERGDLFLAMEFVPGHDLRQIWRACRRLGRPVPVGFACYVVRELCLALHYAHAFTDSGGAARPIIHRDVSPKNVMVTYGGAVKVIDFGIAKAVGSQGRTRAGSAKGTAPYMSPEQVRGEPLDGRSDLFSAGTILHELLTGAQLFAGDSDAESLQKIVHGPVAPPHAQNAQVPEAVSAVVLRALSRNPEDRFPNGKEMAKALTSAAGDAIADEEQAAAVMGGLFSEHMRSTRALLTMVDTAEDDDGAIRQIAGALADAGSGSGSFAQPAATPQARESPAERETVVEAGSARARSRVLVVDDLRTNVAMVKYCLDGSGFDVLGCNDPYQALPMVNEHHPDVIILDVVMPGLDGFEVCRQIREQVKDRYPAILFLSSACSLEERVKGLSVGGDDFVRKPFEGPELVARIRSHLQRNAAMRRISARRASG